MADIHEDSAKVGPPIRNSDHNSVLLRPLNPVPLFESLRRIPVWDFRVSHLSEFLRKLKSTSYDSLQDCSDVDEMVEELYQLFFKCVAIIPCSHVFLSSKDKPWMTPVLKCLINKRWTAFRDKKWTLYNHYKDKVKKQILEAKRIWAKRQSAMELKVYDGLL